MSTPNMYKWFEDAKEILDFLGYPELSVSEIKSSTILADIDAIKYRIIRFLIEKHKKEPASTLLLRIIKKIEAWDNCIRVKDKDLIRKLENL